MRKMGMKLRKQPQGPSDYVGSVEAQRQLGSKATRGGNYGTLPISAPNKGARAGPGACRGTLNVCDVHWPKAYVHSDTAAWHYFLTDLFQNNFFSFKMNYSLPKGILPCLLGKVARRITRRKRNRKGGLMENVCWWFPGLGVAFCLLLWPGSQQCTKHAIGI